MPLITIRHDDLGSAAGQALIGGLDGELLRRYPDRSAVPPIAQEAFTKIAVDEVAPGHGVFLIASVDGVDVGCGAVRDIGDETGELKRMFVLPDHRGLGVASALVASLEKEASGLGLVRVVLEVATFSDDAIAMYAKNGYHVGGHPLRPIGPMFWDIDRGCRATGQIAECGRGLMATTSARGRCLTASGNSAAPPTAPLASADSGRISLVQ